MRHRHIVVRRHDYNGVSCSRDKVHCSSLVYRIFVNMTNFCFCTEVMSLKEIPNLEANFKVLGKRVLINLLCVLCEHIIGMRNI